MDITLKTGNNEKISKVKKILDDACLFSKNWGSYEELKKRVKEVNLIPEDYETVIKKLTEIMGL